MGNLLDRDARNVRQVRSGAWFSDVPVSTAANNAARKEGKRQHYDFMLAQRDNKCEK